MRPRYALAVLVLLAGCGLRDEPLRYTMDGRAMEPTIARGDQPIAKAVDNGKYAPRRGDVVVVRTPDRWRDAGGSPVPGEFTIRRVIGVGGEHVSCCDPDGRVRVNAESLDERYVSLNAPMDAIPAECTRRAFGPVVVPDGELFLLGDNRLASRDSRCLGTVRVADVVAVITPG